MIALINTGIRCHNFARPEAILGAVKFIVSISLISFAAYWV
jgi:hypothetical protein